MDDMIDELAKKPHLCQLTGKTSDDQQEFRTNKNYESVEFFFQFMLFPSIKCRTRKWGLLFCTDGCDFLALLCMAPLVVGTSCFMILLQEYAV